MTMTMRLTWWTPLTFCFPKRYVDAGSFWRTFDIETWSREFYDWTQDDWHGLKDFARPPRETVDSGRGDCEDYALVAASWAVANERPDVGLAFCIDETVPWPSHVVAYDAQRVYSSGVIHERSLESYLADSAYVRALRRRVR